MGRAARKAVEREDVVALPRPRRATAIERLSEGRTVPQISPARLLQDELSARLATAEKPEWSPRRTLAFIVLSSSAGWSLIAVAALLALR